MIFPTWLMFIFVLESCAKDDVLELHEFTEMYKNGNCTEERIAEIKVIEKNCTKKEESLIKDDWEYEWCIYLEHIIGDFFFKELGNSLHCFILKTPHL